MHFNLLPVAATLAVRSQLALAAEFTVLSPTECYKGETETRLCYTAPSNTPQDVSLEDVKFVATRLRAYGQETRAGRLLTMNSADTAGCGEWSIFQSNTVQITAKHIDVAHNSSVLYEDIANTIDGGVNATSDQLAASLYGCGTDGGSKGVVVNATNPAYSSAAYAKLNAVSSGILIKVVSAAV